MASYRVADGEIAEGSRTYSLRESGQLVIVVKEGHSQRLYDGHKEAITQSLNRAEAKAVRDLLDYWLDE